MPQTASLTFPCQYPINIITLCLDDAQRASLLTIMHSADINCTYKLHASKHNRYQSYRFRIEATGEQQLSELHQALISLPFVKMVL